jgi:two-component system, cell cycle sensor histidine kinase and response regulator CckA
MKKLPLGRWTKQTSKNISSEENAPSLPAATSDEKCRQHEAARLEALINSIDQIVLELDAEGTFLNIWANDEKLLYRPRSELLGRRSEDIFDAGFFRSSHELFKRVIATGKGEDFEYSLVFPEGEHWFLARVNRIEYPEGDKTVCVAIREISDRKRTEENLRISEEKFSKAFRAGPDAIVISTLDDGRILDVNYNFIRMTGFARGESVGRTSVDLGIWLNSKERDQMVALVKRDGEVRDLEVRFSVKSGEVRNFQMSAHTIELEGTMCLIAILRDVTERKALEEQLRQAQKMEAVGRLAGGVAHDFNNLLVGILGYSELLKKKVPPGDLLRMTEEINSAAIRARDLTSRLLALSRRQVLQPRVLDFNTLVRQAESLLRPVIGEDIHVEMRLDQSAGSVKADPAQLEQVVLNLALNARDAMPNGGTLAMETCNIEVNAMFARQHPGLIPGKYVRLRVVDTGRGMTPEVMAKIFEPFFTTKQAGVGGGLGLSTVYGIVKQSGGCVTVESEPGKGAAFGIYLPHAPEIPERRIAEPAVMELLTGQGTVLLVEDEPVVLRLASDLLAENGYRVLAASSGSDALSIARNERETIHMLITDVVMPEMSGPELADRVRKLRPGVRVLYMSGYTDDEILCRKGLPENSEFLQKPFTPHQFLQKARATLGTKPARERV